VVEIAFDHSHYLLDFLCGQFESIFSFLFRSNIKRSYSGISSTFSHSGAITIYFDSLLTFSSFSRSRGEKVRSSSKEAEDIHGVTRATLTEANKTN
jgi:hypothetical protein